MANVPESASYDAGIYQIEIVDAVIGGVNGISNLQAKGLANRTNWLKAQVNALNALKGTGIAAHSVANSYTGGQQVIYQSNIWKANTTIAPAAFNPANWTRQLGVAAECALANALPLVDGTAAIGTSTDVAREDHVHPTDSSRAPLNSPPLTGLPTTPDVAAGDSSRLIANTKFAQFASNGLVSVSIAGSGSITLTAAQYGAAILTLTGVLTGNKTVILPNSSGVWTAVNATSGKFTVTLKTAAGSGVAVTQGKASEIYCDGTNVGLQQTDFDSIALSGSSTAPTQAASDSSTKIANTAFTANAVKNNGFAVSTGSANAYVCAFTPVIAARSEGQLLRFKANFANTGASTINDGLGAVALVGVDHSALQGGEIAANGDCLAQWNTSVGGGSYILLISTGVAATPLSQAAVVGGVRNARMAVTVSLATATFTADEIGVKTALGGSAWLLSNFSKTINLGTIGAGGMDAVGPPTNGWVALYAIYNPTTAVSALLAVDVSSSVAPEVYGGASMPAGYTASALVSVWKIQASQFVIANQVDRSLSFPYIQVADSGAQIASLTSVSIAGVVPSNAIACGGFMTVSGTNSTNAITVLASTAGGVGQVQVAGNSTTGGIQNISDAPFSGMKIITSRTLYWQTQVTTGTFGGGTVYVSSYDF